MEFTCSCYLTLERHSRALLNLGLLATCQAIAHTKIQPKQVNELWTLVLIITLENKCQ